MDLRQFRYFIQAARRENFRKASDDLRVAQSALTRQIQRLEQELGFLLFDRVKRGVRLTAAGQRLLERSQHILSEVDRLKESLQIEAHVPSGPASNQRRAPFTVTPRCGTSTRIISTLALRAGSVDSHQASG